MSSSPIQLESLISSISTVLKQTIRQGIPKLLTLSNARKYNSFVCKIWCFSQINRYLDLLSENVDWKLVNKHFLILESLLSNNPISEPLPQVDSLSGGLFFGTQLLIDLLGKLVLYFGQTLSESRIRENFVVQGIPDLHTLTLYLCSILRLYPILVASGTRHIRLISTEHKDISQKSSSSSPSNLNSSQSIDIPPISATNSSINPSIPSPSNPEIPEIKSSQTKTPHFLPCLLLFNISNASEFRYSRSDRHLFFQKSVAKMLPKELNAKEPKNLNIKSALGQLDYCNISDQILLTFPQIPPSPDPIPMSVPKEFAYPKLWLFFPISSFWYSFYSSPNRTGLLYLQRFLDYILGTVRTSWPENTENQHIITSLASFTGNLLQQGTRLISNNFDKQDIEHVKANPSFQCAQFLFSLPEKSIISSFNRVIQPSVSWSLTFDLICEMASHAHESAPFHPIRCYGFINHSPSSHLSKSLLSIGVKKNLVKKQVSKVKSIQTNISSKSTLPNLETVESYNVVVHIHGGGFISGAPSGHIQYLHPWAKKFDSTYFFISVDYLKAPKHIFPKALIQLYCLYCWLCATDQNTDPKWKICTVPDLFHPEKSPWILRFPKLPFLTTSCTIVGDSAGGNLTAALTAAIIRLNTPLLPIPSGIVLYYPVTLLDRIWSNPSRLLNRLDCLIPAGVLMLCLDSYVPEDKVENPIQNYFASPLNIPDEILAKFPRTKIHVAQFDPLMDDGVNFCYKLARAKQMIPEQSLPLVNDIFATPSTDSSDSADPAEENSQIFASKTNQGNSLTDLVTSESDVGKTSTETTETTVSITTSTESTETTISTTTSTVPEAPIEPNIPMNQCYIPNFIFELIDAVESEQHKYYASHGIFRKSPKSTKINAFYDRLINGLRVNSSDPDLLSGLIKMGLMKSNMISDTEAFLQLEFIDSPQPNIKDSNNSEDQESVSTQSTSLLNQTPPTQATTIVNYLKTLDYHIQWYFLRIFKLLKKIHDHSASNDMHSSNLAVIFSPVFFLRDQDPNLFSDNLVHYNIFIKVFIQFFDDILEMCTHIDLSKYPKPPMDNPSFSKTLPVVSSLKSVQLSLEKYCPHGFLNLFKVIPHVSDAVFDFPKWVQEPLLELHPKSPKTISVDKNLVSTEPDPKVVEPLDG